MTRRNLFGALALVTLYFAVLLAIAFYARLEGAEAAGSEAGVAPTVLGALYATFEDFSALLIAIPAAWLASCFARRNGFLARLDRGSGCRWSRRRAAAFASPSNSTRDNYVEAWLSLSVAIDFDALRLSECRAETRYSDRLVSLRAAARYAQYPQGRRAAPSDRRRRAGSQSRGARGDARAASWWPGTACARNIFWNSERRRRPSPSRSAVMSIRGDRGPEPKSPRRATVAEPVPISALCGGGLLRRRCHGVPSRPAAHRRRARPVSLAMDLSSEIIHALLPLFMVGTLGLSVAAVGLIDGIAESTASITKVFSGWISDRLGGGSR